MGLRQPLDDGEAVAIGLERRCKVALCHLNTADLVVRSSKANLIAGVVGLRGGKTGQDAIGFFRAATFLAGIAQGGVIARELDQHPGLLILQFGRWPAVARHIVKQAFRFGKQFERCRARHVVFFRLGHRSVDDVGCGFERCAEKRFVGLELLPRIDGAATRQHREQ